MKHAFLASILIIMIAGSLVLSRQEANKVNSKPWFCEEKWARNAMNVEGYYIVKGESLEKLQKQVRKGLQSNEAWRPLGGVSYDPNHKQYLQIMVHPTNQPREYCLILSKLLCILALEDSGYQVSDVSTYRYYDC